MSSIEDHSPTRMLSPPSSPNDRFINTNLDKSNAPASQLLPIENSSLLTLDQYRFQLYNYAIQAERLRLSQQYSQTNYVNNLQQQNGRVLNYFHPRFQINNEEPKPQHSYIGLIAMAILSNPDMKLVLSDIYQYILDNYSYFRTRGPGWRNSIRHNLSLNDCFIKAGRSANGKGHYWSIHPANVEDFKKGDFRRRKAQRKVRKHMGLSVDDDNDSQSPPPISPPLNFTNLIFPNHSLHCFSPNFVFPSLINTISPYVSRKRQFDVDSLLAPDNDKPNSNFQDFSKKFKPNSQPISEFGDAYDRLKINRDMNLDERDINERIKFQKEFEDRLERTMFRERKTSSRSEDEFEASPKVVKQERLNETGVDSSERANIRNQTEDINNPDEVFRESKKSGTNSNKLVHDNERYISNSNENSEHIDTDRYDVAERAKRRPSEERCDEALFRERKQSSTSDYEVDTDGHIDVVNNNNEMESNKLQESLILQRYYQTIALKRFQIYQQQFQHHPTTLQRNTSDCD